MTAVGWGYSGTLVRMGLQIAAQSVLARVLGPKEFGVFAVLMLAGGVAVVFSDWVSAPVIRAKRLTGEEISFALGCQLCGSFLAMVLVLACLPICQSLFPVESGLNWAVAMMAAGAAITGMGGLSLSLLRRELRYREIHTAQIAGYFVGYVLVGIPVAVFESRSFVALAIAWLVQAGVTSLLLYRAAPHALKASFKHAEHHQFLRFGGQITLGNLGNWVANSCDRLLVASTASAADIGLYNTILNLMMTPVVQLAASLNTVAFSAAAQAGSLARERGSVAYLSLTTLVAALLYGTITAFPASLVTLLYGLDWLDAAALLTPFSIAAVSFAIGAAANAVLTSTGMGFVVAIVQVTSAVTMFIAVWAALYDSLLAAAYSLCIVYALRAGALVVLALRHIGAKQAQSLRLLGVPLALASIQVLFVRAIAESFSFHSIWSQFSLAALSFAIVIVGAMRFRRFLFPPEVQALLSAFSIGVQRKAPRRVAP